MDPLASTPQPFAFGSCHIRSATGSGGGSKLSDFSHLGILRCQNKLVGWLIPIRLVMFAAVGVTGVAVHLMTLRLAITAIDFATARALATMGTITNLTSSSQYPDLSDRRLRGIKFFTGLLSFVICSVSAAANVGIADAVFQQHHPWWLSALEGVRLALWGTQFLRLRHGDD